jgi:hypothetical protein
MISEILKRGRAKEVKNDNEIKQSEINNKLNYGEKKIKCELDKKIKLANTIVSNHGTGLYLEEDNNNENKHKNPKKLKEESEIDIKFNKLKIETNKDIKNSHYYKMLYGQLSKKLKLHNFNIDSIDNFLEVKKFQKSHIYEETIAKKVPLIERNRSQVYKNTIQIKEKNDFSNLNEKIRIKENPIDLLSKFNFNYTANEKNIPLKKFKIISKDKKF